MLDVYIYQPLYGRLSFNSWLYQVVARVVFVVGRCRIVPEVIDDLLGTGPAGPPFTGSSGVVGYTVTRSRWSARRSRWIVVVS